MELIKRPSTNKGKRLGVKHQVVIWKNILKDFKKQGAKAIEEWFPFTKSSTKSKYNLAYEMALAEKNNKKKQ